MYLMYLLFRYHHILPSAYRALPPGERMVIKTFVMAEAMPKQLEAIRWRMESEELTRRETQHA